MADKHFNVNVRRVFFFSSFVSAVDIKLLFYVKTGTEDSKTRRDRAIRGYRRGLLRGERRITKHLSTIPDLRFFFSRLPEIRAVRYVSEAVKRLKNIVYVHVYVYKIL